MTLKNFNYPIFTTFSTAPKVWKTLLILIPYTRWKAAITSFPPFTETGLVVV